MFIPMHPQIHLLEAHSSKVALIPKQPTGEENFIFSYVGLPTGSLRNPTRYNKVVYSIGREKFQKGNTGVGYIKPYEEVGSTFPPIFPSKKNIKVS